MIKLEKDENGFIKGFFTLNNKEYKFASKAIYNKYNCKSVKNFYKYCMGENSKKHVSSPEHIIKELNRCDNALLRWSDF